jgi:uncharacterized protein (DUF983 family)
MSKVFDVLHCKCPKCKKGTIFMDRGNILLFKIPKMNPSCPECNFKFEKETGFFFGAMFVSYALAVGQMILSLIVFWAFIDLSPLKVFLIIALTAFLLATINYRISRAIWIYLFYKD